MQESVGDKDGKSNQILTWLKENIDRLKVPIFSPTILQPLMLISALNCLQQCSGSLYIRKFIIQILESNSDNDTLVAREDALYSDYIDDYYTLDTEIVREGQHNGQDDDGGALNYFLPLIIFSVRLIVLFMMAFMIKKIRMRFLYFLSLFLTVIILSVLGIVSDPNIIPDLGGNSVKFIKTTLLCLHVFFIQFGVQTLPGIHFTFNINQITLPYILCLTNIPA